MPKAEKKTWIVLAQDGRHTTLSAAAAPMRAEVEAAGKMMDTMGIPAWLATVAGDYHGKAGLALSCLDQITEAGGAWNEAVGAFIRKRDAARGI